MRDPLHSRIHSAYRTVIPLYQVSDEPMLPAGPAPHTLVSDLAAVAAGRPLRILRVAWLRPLFAEDESGL